MPWLVLFALCSHLGGCGRKPPTPEAGVFPAKGGTLVYGRGNDAVRLDPADITDGESARVCANIFEGLLRFKPGVTEVEPALATAWRVSEDGLRYEFDLREGVKFHDGTPLTAEAVVFSLERQRDPDHPYHQGDFVYWGSYFSDVQKTIALSENKVAILLRKRSAPLLRNLAMFSAAIISPEAVRIFSADWPRHPVGTGPFKFVEWQPMEKIVLERNDTYWDDSSHLDRVVFKPVPDNTARFLQLASGALDVADGLNPEDLGNIRSDPRLKLVEQPGMNVAYLAMNNLKKPFDDVRVRQAVALLLDKSAIVEHLYYGTAVPAVNLLPPTVWGYNEAIRDRKPDLAAVRDLLDAAGFSEGFSTTLWTMSNPRPYLPQPLKTAEVIKAQLKKGGIDATIVTYEWGTYLEKTENGDHDMCLLGWTGDNGDPDNFLFGLLDKTNTTPGTASNVSFYRGEELHELLVLAQEEMNDQKRKELYERAQEVVFRDVPLIPVAHADQVAAISTRVHGFELHPVGYEILNRVWLEKQG